MLKILGIVIGAVVALVVVIVIIGYMLPKAHTARMTVRLSKSPAEVWAVITDHAAEPTWRKDLEKVERLADAEGHPVWREIQPKGFALTLETIEIDAPKRMVRRIADKNLPFSGSWTYELTSPEGGGCVLTITENGEVSNPVFRLVSRFMDQSATMKGYLTALAARLGESSKPQVPS